MRRSSWRRGLGHLGAQRNGECSERRPYGHNLAGRRDSLGYQVLEKSLGELVELFSLHYHAAGGRGTEQGPELSHQETPGLHRDIAVADAVHHCPCRGPCVFLGQGKTLTGRTQHVVRQGCGRLGPSGARASDRARQGETKEDCYEDERRCGPYKGTSTCWELHLRPLTADRPAQRRCRSTGARQCPDRGHSLRTVQPTPA